jgi:adenylate cyclase
MALLHIVDASGREWNYTLTVDSVCTIGRAPDNCVVLNDPRVSRYHAHLKFENGRFQIIDGIEVAGQIRRSANKVYVNGSAQYELDLRNDDLITIGTSSIRFEESEDQISVEVKYDDRRLGFTQLLVSSGDIITTVLKPGQMAESEDSEIEQLRRKADILSLLYEMSKTLSSVFNLNAISDKATDIVFRVTPADRVVALLTNEPWKEDSALTPVSFRVRDSRLLEHAKNLTIGRTITKKVMKERVALLSQDARADEHLSTVDSIVSQGVRSTICAPLVAESGVHGALYADRLDPFAVFTRDDLELISAIAAQTAIAVENARSHERLSREEVARANYRRFLPRYVVDQMLENPDSFKLGGVNQIVTVLFADIRGFTTIAEHARPDQVVHLLNRYFSRMTDIIFQHGGTLDKYIGDGLMALFGAPSATAEDATNALCASIAMQRQVRAINEELITEGFPEISIGIGLHTGEATVGYIGSELRSEYTAIGDTVNLAARLEACAQGGQILVTEDTATAAAKKFKLSGHEPLRVKNRHQPAVIFELEWN